MKRTELIWLIFAVLFSVVFHCGFTQAAEWQTEWETTLKARIGGSGISLWLFMWDLEDKVINLRRPAAEFADKLLK